MHHNIFYEITNRCSYMQSILFHCLFHSTCFGCFTHPSSGVQSLTVSTATGTNHSIVSATYSQRGLQATLGVSNWDDTMVFTSGCRYSYKLYSWWWVCKTPETCRVNLAVEKNWLHIAASVGYFIDYSKVTKACITMLCVFSMSVCLSVNSLSQVIYYDRTRYEQ